MPDKIYTITVVGGNASRMRSRCWGYYFHQHDAACAIEANEPDISEHGYYQFGLLASLPEGPLAMAEEIQWYEFIWNFDTKPRKHDGLKIPELVLVSKTTRPEMCEGIAFGGM